MAYSLNNKCTSNYWNRTNTAEVIKEVGWYTFLQHSVKGWPKRESLLISQTNCGKTCAKSLEVQKGGSLFWSTLILGTARTCGAGSI